MRQSKEIVKNQISNVREDDNNGVAFENGIHVSTTVETEVDVPIKDFYQWLSTTSLENILPGTRMIPAVVKTELQTAVWGEVNSKRKVFLADGTTVLEQITHNEPPHYFSYKVWNFSNFINRFAKYGRGEFFIKDFGAKTKVFWKYSFRPHGLTAYPLLKLIVKTAFRDFMKKGSETIKKNAELNHLISH